MAAEISGLAEKLGETRTKLGTAEHEIEALTTKVENEKSQMDVANEKCRRVQISGQKKDEIILEMKSKIEMVLDANKRLKEDWDQSKVFL